MQLKLFRTPKIFVKRQFSDTLPCKTNDKQAVLKIITWSPSKQELDKRGQVISRIPMTALQAKRALLDQVSENIHVDPFGHAAAELRVNFDASPASLHLSKLIQRLTKLSEKEFQNIQSLHAYISWFPKTRNSASGIRELATTGRVIDTSLRQKFEITQGYEDISVVKRRITSFLEKEYEAEGGDLNADTLGYGKPENNRVFSLSKLDFENIIRQCFKMMKFTISENSEIIMKDVLPEATYYGLDMLREHSKLIKSSFNNELSPEHVCTTAVLRLLKAGIGTDEYYKIIEKIISDNTSLSHGYPIVELTHAVTKEVYLRECEKNQLDSVMTLRT